MIKEKARFFTTLTGDERPAEISAFISFGGEVDTSGGDFDPNQIFKLIYSSDIGTSGVVKIERADGAIVTYYIQTGDKIWVGCGRKIIASGTTATGLYWGGGK